MSKISLSPDASGTATFTIASPGTSTNRTINLPDASTTIPVASQVITFAGPTAARTYTFPDAAATIARTDASQTFAAGQVFTNTIGVGGATASTSGSGITFPATQSASTNANTLDDYEEGTWTPEYGTTGTQPTGITYSIQVGRYTKIGNIVFIGVSVTLSNKGTGGTGLVAIRNLPFSIANITNYFSSFGAEVDNLGSDKRTVTAVTIPNTTTFVLNGSSGSTAGTTALDVVDINNNTVIRFGAFFTTA